MENPYDIKIDPKLEELMGKIKRKDKSLHERVMKKILKLAENPKQGKPLRNILKGRWRVQIGPFVLVYTIDENQHKVVFLEFEHHDKAY